MSDELLPIDLDLSRPKRKKGTSVKKLLEEISDLRQEREGLLERCHIAERAAYQNLVYAQAARQATEDMCEKLMTRLNEIHATSHPQNPNH
jgi:hypothetical protein